jgi:AcrR family transcriptional regulator
MATSRDFNEAVTAAVRAEQAARGWSIDEFVQRSGIAKRTLYRLVGKEPGPDREQPEWKAGTIAAVAGAFGMPVSALMAAAEQRVAPVAPPMGVSDPRTLIRFLLDHPDQDHELLTRISDAASHVGTSSVRAKRLAAEIRSNRRDELQHALESLPSTDRANNG